MYSQSSLSCLPPQRWAIGSDFRFGFLWSWYWVVTSKVGSCFYDKIFLFRVGLFLMTPEETLTSSGGCKHKAYMVQKALMKRSTIFQENKWYWLVKAHFVAYLLSCCLQQQAIWYFIYRISYIEWARNQILQTEDLFHCLLCPHQINKQTKGIIFLLRCRTAERFYSFLSGFIRKRLSEELNVFVKSPQTVRPFFTGSSYLLFTSLQEGSGSRWTAIDTEHHHKLKCADRWLSKNTLTSLKLNILFNSTVWHALHRKYSNRETVLRWIITQKNDDGW